MGTTDYYDTDWGTDDEDEDAQWEYVPRPLDWTRLPIWVVIYKDVEGLLAKAPNW